MRIEDRIARVRRILDGQMQTLEAVQGSLATKLPIWRDRTIRLLSQDIIGDELKLLSSINTSSWNTDKSEYRDFLVALKAGIEEFPETYLIQATEEAILDQTSSIETVPNGTNERHPIRVFVVHGHDTLARVEVARMSQMRGLRAVVPYC